MSSGDGHRAQLVRCVQPMQNPSLQRPGGYGSSFTISSSPRLEPLKEHQALQWPSGHAIEQRGSALVSATQRSSGFGNRDRGFAVTSTSPRLEPSKRPGGYAIEQRGGAAVAVSQPRLGVQPVQGPTVVTQPRQRVEDRVSSVISAGSQTRQDPDRPNGSCTPKHASDVDALQVASGRNSMGPGLRQDRGFTSGSPDLQVQRSPLAGTSRAHTSSRSSWPPVKRPSPGRVEEVAMPDSKSISLDEFLDKTNAPVPEVRACRGDDDTMGDNLLSTLHSVSSFSKVDAEETVPVPVRMPKENVATHEYSASLYSLVDVPAKESSWEYELDRENSNAAALLLCHTATPKLSLHPRGLRSVSGAPVSFETASHPKDGSGKRLSQDENSPDADGQQPAEDVSLTWKLLGAADKAVQFFSSLRPIEENRRFASHALRHTLPNPKRLQPNELFESRQQDQMKQAADSLKDAVKKLIAASGTTNADQATYRLPVEIRCRFARLRQRLVEALGNGQQPVPDANVLAVNLERFVSTCNYLAQADPGSIDRELRQEFISFSQRHAQDLELHCRTFKWLAEQRSLSREFASSGVVRSVGVVREPGTTLGAVREPGTSLGAVREHYVQPGRIAVRPYANHAQHS